MSKLIKVSFSPIFFHEVERKKKKKKPLHSDSYGVGFGGDKDLFFWTDKNVKKK